MSAELLYDEAVRSMDRVQAIAGEMRNAAGLLIATAAIAISLLDGGASSGGVATACGSLALASFLVVALSALAVIWPRRDIPATAGTVSVLTSLPERPEAARGREDHRLLIMRLGVQQVLLARRNAVLSRAFRVGGFALPRAARGDGCGTISRVLGWAHVEEKSRSTGRGVRTARRLHGHLVHRAWRSLETRRQNLARVLALVLLRLSRAALEAATA